jgi:selenocysteine lyase/cysteine desulfurase
LRGPRGTGFAYVKEKARIRSNHFDLAAADLVFDANGKATGLSMVDSARQFELWERSVALMLGLSEAIFESCQAMESGKLAVANNFAKQLRAEVSANPSFSLIGEIESPSCTIGYICNDPSVEGAMRAAFGKHDISYSSMGNWDCPLHFPKNGATTIFRLSPHYYTSIETIDAAVEAIRSI